MQRGNVTANLGQRQKQRSGKWKTFGDEDSSDSSRKGDDGILPLKPQKNLEPIRDLVASSRNQTLPCVDFTMLFQQVVVAADFQEDVTQRPLDRMDVPNH
jgi:hypothetical protein